MIGYRIPVFTKRAKRNLITHPKFYYFDSGVYHSIQPRGPLDPPEEADGPALETLFLQEFKAINDYFELGYDCFYWHTRNNLEVDFVLYGENGLHAFAIKRKTNLTSKDFKGLQTFHEDYPMAKLYMLYGGNQIQHENNIQILPYAKAIVQLKDLLQA